MLVDTNVLIDVLENDPDWADWSVGQLRAQSRVYQLIINLVIYSELSLTLSTVEALDQVLDDMELPVVEIPKPALFLAGKAFVQHRRNQGTKSHVLPDFYRRPRRCQRTALVDPGYPAIQDLFLEYSVGDAGLKNFQENFQDIHQSPLGLRPPSEIRGHAPFVIALDPAMQLGWLRRPYGVWRWKDGI